MKDAWIPTYKNLSERISNIYRGKKKKGGDGKGKSLPLSKEVTVDRIRLVEPFRTIAASRITKSPKSSLSPPPFSPKKRLLPEPTERNNRSMLDRPYHSVKLECIRPWTQEGYDENR